MLFVDEPEFCSVWYVITIVSFLLFLSLVSFMQTNAGLQILSEQIDWADFSFPLDML